MILNYNLQEKLLKTVAPLVQETCTCSAFLLIVKTAFFTGEKGAKTAFLETALLDAFITYKNHTSHIKISVFSNKRFIF